MSYTMYTPLNVWLDPASVTDVVAYIQTYLRDNPIYSETEIETLIHDYLIAHPELIGGVQSVNGKTGTVVLSASDINTENDVTIEAVLATLSSQISTIAANVSTNTANITNLTGRMTTAETDLSNLKSNFDSLDYLVRYETEDVIAEKSVSITSGTKVDAEISTINVSISNGASFKFRVNGTNLINIFALYYNEGGSSHRFGTGLLPNTDYQYTAPTDITSLYIYTAASDVIGSGELQLIVKGAVVNNDSIEKRVIDIEQDIENLIPLSGDKWNLDRSSFTTICVHHDNFSRTMTGWDIGMNAGGTDTGNSYDWVTPSTYDDGLRVDNGATFESGTRTYTFSLRKIAEAVSDNFLIETNAPILNYPIMFGFDVTDIKNLRVLEIRKNNAGYRIIMRSVMNGSYQTPTLDITCPGLGQVMSVYCVHGIMYFYLDDTLLCSSFVGTVGNYVYLASINSYNTHFEFVNVFNVVSKTAWNPNRVLDTGVSDVPLKTVSANTGNYVLQNTTTRWSNYADHMTLHSDDDLIHNGRRCEISIGNMNDYKGNLRHFIISFDVLFPSEYIDTEQGDLFVQTHDRDGTYRGTVPFALYIKNNVININTSSTYAPKDDSTSVIVDLHRLDFAEIELGKWHHFDIEIKERYEERQNPFLKITIDGITQFEYRKANCYNDLLGTSPQYGIYKNNWGTGVTEFQRYFDNFKIEYI